MRKVIKGIIVAVAVLCILLTLVACSPTKETYFTVTFVQKDKADVVFTVKNGDALAEEDIPLIEEDAPLGYDLTWSVEDFSRITKNLKVNVVKVPKTFSVEYNLGADGRFPDEAQPVYDVVFGQSYVLAEPVRENYEFVGYKNGDKDVALAGEWEIPFDVRLTAIWRQTVVTVTFTADGYDNIVKTVNVGEDLTDIPSPYIVKGYNTAWSVSDFTALTEDTVVTLDKTPKTYTVTLDADGGECETDALNLTYDAQYVLPSAIRDGFNFVGWTYDGQVLEMSGIYGIDDDNATFVAEWTERPTVTFTDGDVIIKIAHVDENGDLSAQDIPEIAGYTVDWGREFVGITESITVAAQKTANSYGITFDVGEFGEPLQGITVVYGQPYVLPQVQAIEGYAFKGWLIDGQKITDGENWSVADDVVLVAEYVKLVKVTFSQRSGTEIVWAEVGGSIATDAIPAINMEDYSEYSKDSYRIAWNKTDLNYLTQDVLVEVVIIGLWSYSY